jgi:hypothetical protein
MSQRWASIRWRSAACAACCRIGGERVVLLEEGKVADEGPAAETLFGHRELQTSLQRLTGRAWPASPADLPPVDRR